MSKPVIAIADSPFPSLDPVKKALAKLNPEYRISKSTSAEDILAVARDADAIIVCYAKITADIINQLTKCKVIGRTGLGVDNIDIPAAAAKKITVTYVPDYCLREVSDHAMALLLALARKVTVANKSPSRAAGTCRRSSRSIASKAARSASSASATSRARWCRRRRLSG